MTMDQIDYVLGDFDDDIRAAREFTTAISFLTETINSDKGLPFQRLAFSVLDHIKKIERRVDGLRQAMSTAAMPNASACT